MKSQTIEQAYERYEQLGLNLARYWTVPVSVVVELGSYALVRRGDGLSFIVETSDLIDCTMGINRAPARLQIDFQPIRHG